MSCIFNVPHYMKYHIGVFVAFGTIAKTAQNRRPPPPTFVPQKFMFQKGVVGRLLDLLQKFWT